MLGSFSVALNQSPKEVTEINLDILVLNILDLDLQIISTTQSRSLRCMVTSPNKRKVIAEALGVIGIEWSLQWIKSSSWSIPTFASQIAKSNLIALLTESKWVCPLD